MLQKEDLGREVAMYKSVYVHPDQKVRTNITRIHRVALKQTSTNDAASEAIITGCVDLDTTFSLREHLSENNNLFNQALDGIQSGSMTWDEIM